MAKHTILKERGTGEELYPQTLAKFVQTEGGDNVDEAISKVKFALFVDMWENRCRFNGKDHYFGKYNKETGFFELNEITDISYEEALQIWTLSFHLQMPYDRTQPTLQYLFGGTGYIEYNSYSKCRTYFPIIAGNGYNSVSCKHLFHYNSVVQTINFVGGYGNRLADLPNLSGAFTNCIKLRKILCNIGLPTIDNDTFKYCTQLEYINITPYIDNKTFNFQWSPKLSIESFKLFVTNAIFMNNDPNHGKTLNVIVHPDVYSKLTDESNTEWNQVLIDAASKNITFATT